MLRILYHDSTSNYKELLNRSSKVSMEEERLRNLSLEISKTLNHLNLEQMKEIFHKTTNLTHRPFDVKANKNNITKYGNKSLRSLRSYIWSSLSKQIKQETDYNKFKNFTDKWFGAKCKYNLCSYLS